MSYEERAELHERLLERFFTLQRRYAALEGPGSRRAQLRARIAGLIVGVRLELVQLRESREPGPAPDRPPPPLRVPARAPGGGPRARSAIVRCALCGFVAVYISWAAAEEGGWRGLRAEHGKGVCPACIADDAGGGEPPSSGR